MSPPRLLVLEDEALVANDLERRLTKLGYSITACAMTAENAIALARQHRPDLVLSDIQIQGTQEGIAAAGAIPACRWFFLRRTRMKQPCAAPAAPGRSATSSKPAAKLS